MVETEIDLRGICRNPQLCGVTIYLVSIETRGKGTGWLRLGEASLEAPDFRQEASKWRLKSYLAPRSEKESVPTDREHDSAYACVLPLIGVTMLSIRYHQVTLSAWIDPNAKNHFHVPPSSDYDPRKHKDAIICQDENCLKAGIEDGGGPHIIVPEGFYIPPFDPELYEAVKGKQVEIFFYNESLKS